MIDVRPAPRLRPRCPWLAVLLAGGVAACGRSGPAPRSDATAPPLEVQASSAQPAAGLLADDSRTRAAGGAGSNRSPLGAQPSDRGATKAVAYEALEAAIPEVSGWTKSDVRGEQVTVPVSYSRAQARFRKDDGRIELEITDTALGEVLLAPLTVFLASGFTERTESGLKRAVPVSGRPGLEDWNAKASRGEVTAVIGSRFVVRAVGHGVQTIDVVRRVVEAVDFPRLEATR